MAQNAISQIYDKMQLHFYRKIYSNFEHREATLTTVETFSMEVILALGNPTVAQFANAVEISSPNAAHRIQCLVQKGYVEKVRSESDAREFHLKPTNKYFAYRKINQDYMNLIMERCKERFSEEDYNKLNEMLEIMSNELMPEIDIKDYKFFDM